MAATISKYRIIAEALNDVSSNIGNYLKGNMSGYKSQKVSKVQKASELYDKELEAFKKNVIKKIQEID